LSIGNKGLGGDVTKMLHSKRVCPGKAADAIRADQSIGSLELGAQKSPKYQQAFLVNSKEI
jgi:hypothetical protein